MLSFDMRQPLQKVIPAIAMTLLALPAYAEGRYLGPREAACDATRPQGWHIPAEAMDDWEAAHPHGCLEAQRQDERDAAQLAIHPRIDRGYSYSPARAAEER